MNTTISFHNPLIIHNTVKPQDAVLTILLHARRAVCAVFVYAKAVKNMTSFVFTQFLSHHDTNARNKTRIKPFF
jgi:hypothetical protein